MPSRWRRNLFAIWIAELLAVAAFSGANPIIPFYVRHLGVADLSRVKLWAGMVQTAGAAAVALFAPIWGRLADAYGRRIMLLRALLGGAVTMVLMGLATHPWQLVLFRGLGGMFTGTVAAATTLVASTVPRDKAGYSLGMLQTSILVGSALGPVLGGSVADLLGYRVPFFLNALLFLAASITVLTVVREDFTPRSLRGQFWRSVLPDFSLLGRSRELLSLMLLVALIQLASAALTPILPLFIQSLRPAAALIGTTSGLIIGARALAGAAAAAVIGRLSDRLGYRRILLVCLVGGILAHLPLLLVRTPWQLFFLRLAAGVFMGGTLPTVNALIAARAAAGSHGSVYGLSSSMSAAGSAAGPAMGASIAALASFNAVFLTIAGVLSIGLAAAGLVLRPPRRAGGRPGERPGAA